MWIMLRCKLPTLVSPPKLSIHWSVPWPMVPEGEQRRKKRRGKTCWQDPEAAALAARCDEDDEEREQKKQSEKELFGPPALFGATPNYAGARKIMYGGEAIRVFPHEFSEVTAENMQMYLDEGAMELQPGSAAEDNLLEAVLSKGQREVYEQALCDGATTAQATMMALGQDPTLPDSKFPPIGWYKFKDEVMRVFCRKLEMNAYAPGETGKGSERG